MKTKKTKAETAATVVFDQMTAEADWIKSMNLWQRINWIRSEVPNLSRDAKLDKYRGVSHDQVTDAIRPLLVKYGVLTIPSLQKSEAHDTNIKYKSGRQLVQYRSSWTVEFVNIDVPEQRFSIRVEGHADEAGDKGPGKVASYAIKYAYLKMFAMAAGEAPWRAMIG